MFVLPYLWASLVAQTVKESACHVGELEFDPWVGKTPWRRERLPTPIFWPGGFHGQRSLTVYIVHGVTKSQTQLSDFHFSLSLVRFFVASYEGRLHGGDVWPVL